jgi:hypothetical protein
MPVDFVPHEAVAKGRSRAQDDVQPAPPVRRATAPLVVGPADDRAEHEADRVAHEVISRLESGESGESHVHDGCHGVARTAAPVSAGPVSASSVSGAPEVGRDGGAISAGLTARIESRRGSGQALPDGVRRTMESGFGRSLADVRIHTDGEAARLNRSVSARAFTTGKDIFFGAGEYSPDTAAGRTVLAHEIAHTQQGGTSAQRIHRRWDINQKDIDWGRGTAVRTPTQRFVFFISDGTAKDDEIVVKIDTMPVGLNQLAGFMHHKLGAADSVVTKKLGEKDRRGLASILNDPGKVSDASLARAADMFGTMAEHKIPGEDVPADRAGKIDYGRRMFHRIMLNTKDNMMAMTKAQGVEAESTMQMPGDGGASRMRGYLEDVSHVQRLGRVAAIDLFLGNVDRVTRFNMGNWYYDQKGAITLIDHVDQGSGMASKMAKNGKFEEWKQTCGQPLATEQGIKKTAKESVKRLDAEGPYTGDPGIKQWLDEKLPGGTTRRQNAEEAMARGMSQETARIVKIFAATSFFTSSKQDRKQRSSFKAAAKITSARDQGHSAFQGDQPDYWEALKARARWIKNPS